MLGRRRAGHDRHPVHYDLVRRRRGLRPRGRRLADLPPVRLSPQASAAAWTGSGVLAWDYELRAAFYDPGRNAWRRLPRPPMAFCEGYPDLAANGRVAFARGCGDALWIWTLAAGSRSGNGLVTYHP